MFLFYCWMHYLWINCRDICNTYLVLWWIEDLFTWLVPNYDWRNMQIERMGINVVCEWFIAIYDSVCKICSTGADFIVPIHSCTMPQINVILQPGTNSPKLALLTDSSFRTRSECSTNKSTRRSKRANRYEIYIFCHVK